MKNTKNTKKQVVEKTEQKTVYEKSTIMRAMFNGKTLKDNFRRGFWKKQEFLEYKGKKPSVDFKDNTIAFLWYNGVVAFYINKEKEKLVFDINTSFRDNGFIMAIIDFIKGKNTGKTFGLVYNFTKKAARISNSNNEKSLEF